MGQYFPSMWFYNNEDEIPVEAQLFGESEEHLQKRLDAELKANAEKLSETCIAWMIELNEDREPTISEKNNICERLLNSIEFDTSKSFKANWRQVDKPKKNRWELDVVCKEENTFNWQEDGRLHHTNGISNGTQSIPAHYWVQSRHWWKLDFKTKLEIIED